MWKLRSGAYGAGLEYNGNKSSISTAADSRLEVINMLLDEWDLDTALKVEREEGMGKCVEIGIGSQRVEKFGI
jgi:hypothetical protein